MEPVITGALAEGIRTGRLPAWLILALGIVVALFRIAKPVGSAAIGVVAHVARIEKIGSELAESLRDLARGNTDEHTKTRAEIGKVGAQVTALEASLRIAVAADGSSTRTAIDGLERTVLDSRTSRAVERIGELAAVVEASVDEVPPVEMPPRRARAHSRPG